MALTEKESANGLKFLLSRAATAPGMADIKRIEKLFLNDVVLLERDGLSDRESIAPLVVQIRSAIDKRKQELRDLLSADMDLSDAADFLLAMAQKLGAHSGFAIDNRHNMIIAVSAKEPDIRAFLNNVEQVFTAMNTASNKELH